MVHGSIMGVIIELECAIYSIMELECAIYVTLTTHTHNSHTLHSSLTKSEVPTHCNY